MKNFLRSLRFAYPYRIRLGVSIACALVAAALWGVTLTAIYPSLKILGTNKSLQQWADEEIGTSEELVRNYEANLQSFANELDRAKAKPESVHRDKLVRDLTSEMVRIETKLNSSRTMLCRLQIVKGRVLVWLPPDRFLTLAWLMGILVGAVAVKGFFEFWQESLVGSVVNLSLYDLRNQFYRKAIHFDMNSFGEEGTHELMARFTNDIELLGTGCKTLFGKVVAEPLRALSCVILACWISWQLTLLFLVLVPLALFFLSKVGRMMKRATRRLLERMSLIYKMLQETFQGIRIVKAFTMEPYERRRFRAATRDYYQKAMLVVNIDALASPVIELLGVGAVSVALLTGAYLVMNHETHLFGMRMTEQPLDAEGLLQLYGFLAAIADPVRKLSSVYTRLQSGAAAADRIFDYLDRQPRVRAMPSAPPLPRHSSTVEFRGVCFSYKPGEPILDQIQLTCRFGETIAFVGHNGCGKTTLLSLLPRFHDPDHGAILIDGMDIRKVNLRSLRKQIALVSQDTTLFDDTIYNNIAYGHRRASKEQVEEAATQTFAHEFIVDLPNGYETRVGDRAAKLSGGQKQRIALARAVLRNPSILILDEFTNQADPVSEARIHQWLHQFARNRTTLLITHRLNTLEIADRIVVLDGGRIEAVGTHRELLNNCVTYQRLHERRCCGRARESMMNIHRRLFNLAASLGRNPGTAVPGLGGSLLLLVAVALPLFFYRLGDRDLWSSHEARAAMNAAAVLHDHTWGVSRLFDGHLELQKPPLYYWLVAAVARLNGGEVDAWAVRLPAALAGLACLLWLCVWLRARGRPGAAVLAPLILATAGQFPWLARVGRIDMPLTLCVSVALGCFHLALERRSAGRRTWHLWLGAYLAVAVGLLLKGPIALVLPAAVGLAHLLSGGHGPFPWRRPWRAVPASLLWGVPLVLLLAAPWFVYAHWQTHGEFTRQFFWHHNVERGFGGDDALQAHPWWFYGHTFVERFLPWSPFIGIGVWWVVRREGGASVGGWKPPLRSLDAEARFGLIWLATTVLLLSCMRFKRADYLLPAFPGAALFLGCVGERWLQTLTRPRWALASFAGVVGAVVLGWWIAVAFVLPGFEPTLGQRAFAAAVRREVPAPQLVLWFRAENHALAYRLGEPLNTFLEWENLDIWAGRPGTHYILMPPECAAEWPEHVSSGRLEKVLANTDLIDGIPRHQQVVLMRTVPEPAGVVRQKRLLD